MATCLIGLGANVGHRQALLEEALDAIQSTSRMEIVATSSWHETRPVGLNAPASPFLNGAAVMRTDLAPSAVLSRLLAVESQLGRVRSQRWESRPVDLDLLLYDDRIEISDNLVIPHPRLSFRRFVLEPACEIAPSWRDPVSERRLEQLLDHLNQTPPYVVIVAGNRASVANLLTDLPEQTTLPVTVLSREAEVHTEPVDPASCSIDAPLEWLECRMARVNEALAGGDRWLVSDEWLPLMIEQLHGSGHEPADQPVSVPWNALSNRWPQPKLLVLAVDQAAGEPLTESPLGVGAAIPEGVHREWVRRHGGPWLVIDMRDPSWSRRELIAALEAMAVEQ